MVVLEHSIGTYEIVAYRYSLSYYKKLDMATTEHYAAPTYIDFLVHLFNAVFALGLGCPEAELVRDLDRLDHKEFLWDLLLWCLPSEAAHVGVRTVHGGKNIHVQSARVQLPQLLPQMRKGVM